MAIIDFLVISYLEVFRRGVSFLMESTGIAYSESSYTAVAV